MKVISKIFCLFLFLSKAYSQITIIQTGTSSDIQTPSIIGNKILINGYNSYLVESLNECNSLTQLTPPGPTGHWNILSRADSGVVYMVSSELMMNHTLIYKSIDFGHNWTLKLDTPNYYAFLPVFFDSLEGMVFSTYNKALRTKDGGNTWLTSSHYLTLPTVAKAFQDSTIYVGGSGSGGIGQFIISNNKGKNYTLGGQFGQLATVTDFFCLNKDTAFVVADPGLNGTNFAKSFNGGANWQYSTITNSNMAVTSIYVKSKNECYAVGVTSGSIGLILKSTDLGDTWTTFNTQVKSNFFSLAFMNDSIALVSGSEGVLFKWNYRTAIFTGLMDNSHSTLGIAIFPNPVTDKLQIRTVNGSPLNLHLTINNNLGQTVFEKEVQTNQEIELGSLPSGVYYLKVKSEKGQKVFKVIKE